MTLVKWTPKRNMMNIFDEVEHMMHQAFGNSLDNKMSTRVYSPSMNVSENQTDYLVMMDIPGVEKKDVKVNLSNGILTVSGERKASVKGDERSRIWHEKEMRIARERREAEQEQEAERHRIQREREAAKREVEAHEQRVAKSAQTTKSVLRILSWGGLVFSGIIVVWIVWAVLMVNPA